MKKKGDVRSALHMAVEAGNFELVKDLLHHDTADINKQDSNGWTPLHSACMGGKLDIIELLLQNEHCSAGLRSCDGSTPLHYLVRHFPTDPALCHQTEKEKEKEKDQHKKRSSRRSRESLDKDNPKVQYRRLCRLAKRLKKRGCDPCAANVHGETALHHAALRGRVTAVEFLLRKKKWNVNVNSCTEHVETPLHFAGRSGSADTVRMLVEKGVDPGVKGKKGTALEVAQTLKNSEAILAILQDVSPATTSTTSTTTSTTHSLHSSLNSTTFHHHHNGHHNINNNFWFKTQEELLKEQKEKTDEIREWIQQMHLPNEYVEALVADGFDDLNTIKLISEADLQDLGITKTGHRKKILHWASQHPYVPINFNYRAL